jgi:hypothetical protein
VGWRAQVGRWAALALLLGFMPFNLSLMGYVHKTPLLTACFLCAASWLFATSARGRRPTPVESTVVLALAFVGAVVRGYSLAAALPIVWYWAWLAMPGGPDRRAGIRRSGALALGIILLFVVADRALVYGLLDARRSYKSQIVFRYDLAAIHAFTGRVYAGAFLRDAYRDRRAAYGYYHETYGLWRIKDMYRRARTPEELAALRADWARAIVENPRAYLTHRWHAIALSLGLPGRVWGARQFETDSPQNTSGLRQPRSRLRDLIDGLQARVRNRFFMMPWFWALANVCLSLVAVVLLRRGARPTATLLPHAVMCWSGLLLLLPYLLVCLDRDARFTYWVTVSTCFGGLGVVSAILGRFRPGGDSVERGPSRCPGQAAHVTKEGPGG